MLQLEGQVREPPHAEAEHLTEQPQELAQLTPVLHVSKAEHSTWQYPEPQVTSPFLQASAAVPPPPHSTVQFFDAEQSTLP